MYNNVNENVNNSASSIKKDSIKLPDVHTCTLCGACIASCQRGAITFEKSYLDFKYPQIDSQKCINCGLCEQTCPVLREKCNASAEQATAYVMRNTDAEVRKKSTSGGIFLVAAEWILSNGGYVCGSVLNSNFDVSHICSNDMSDIFRMMGSKYAQSEMTHIFPQIKNLLKNRKFVLFTGCPCQIAGLRTYLKKEYDNLVLVELVCHGIPSNKMLHNYIKLLEERYHSRASNIQFRNKKNGWHSSRMIVTFVNGKEYSKPIILDAYFRGFISNVYLKESCYNCQFHNFQSGADVMIGDFWGAEVELPEVDDNTGLSAVLVRTEKGERFLNTLDVEQWKISADQIIRYNRNIIESAIMNPARSTFYKYAEDIGLNRAIAMFFWEKPCAMMKRKIQKVLRRVYYRLKGKKKPIY